MGKKKSSVGAMEEDAAMDMSPMIDMVFLLLIFFVVNATAITVKREKNVVMPTASDSGEIKSANGYVVVNVWADKRPKGLSAEIAMGDEDGNALATPADLGEYIKGKKELFVKQGLKEEELRLYIRGDQKALYKHAREVMKQGADNGIPNVVFGAVTPKPE